MALRGGRQLLQLLASSNASQTCSRLPQQAPLCAAASCSWQGTAGTLPSAPCSTQQHPQHQQRRWRSHSSSEGDKWRMLAQRGEKLNPCNSPLHPAARAGIKPDAEEVLSVQLAYTPKSTCFGCGPAHPDGLYLESKRIRDGLEATISIPATYCAFPGIVNGGIVTTLMDCHGNWSAAIALMDKSCLSKPPLTLTDSVFLSYKEPTPPNTPLVIRSKIINMQEKEKEGWNRATVEVDVNLYQVDNGKERLLVSGTVLCKQLGALREL